MASLTPLDLAALLCSRVCHDVISPVGAIINGLEVLDGEQDEEMRAVAMELIKKSAISASARLQFCRLAFGAAGSFGASIDTGDAEKVARDFSPTVARLCSGAAGDGWRRETPSSYCSTFVSSPPAPCTGAASSRSTSRAKATAMMIRVEARGTNARLSHNAADILTNARSQRTNRRPFHSTLFHDAFGLRVSSDAQRVNLARKRHADGRSSASAHGYPVKLQRIRLTGRQPCGDGRLTPMM